MRLILILIIGLVFGAVCLRMSGTFIGSNLVEGRSGTEVYETKRSSSFDPNLTWAREQLAQSARAGDDEQHAVEAVAKDGAAKIQAAEKQAAMLADKLAAAEQAAAQVDTLQKRLDSEQARSTGLDHDLGVAREQLAQSARAGDDEQHAVEAVAKDDAAKIQAAEKQAAMLADKLAAAEQAAAQVDTLQKRLDSEQARSTGLDHDLGVAREQLAQSARAGDDEQHAVEAVAKDGAAKIQAAEKQAAMLADKLAAAEQAAAQVDTLQKRLDSEQARSTGLDHDLGVAREQLAQSARAGDDEQHAVEAVAKDDAAKIQAAEKQAAMLADKLAAAEQAAAQVDTLQKRLDSEQARSTGLDHDFGVAREQLAQSARAGDDEQHAVEAVAKDGAAKIQAAEKQAAMLAGSSPMVLERAKIGGFEAPKLAALSFQRVPDVAAVFVLPRQAAQTTLPRDVVAHVVVRYPRASESARARASRLMQALRADGLVVAEPVEVPSRIAADGVTYFYGEDQNSARRVAEILATTGPVQSHLSAFDALPRPGMIEVAIAG